MDKPNLYTTKLKLNNHKINFQILDENILKLEGSSIDTTQIILNVVLPGILGLLLLVLGIFLKMNIFGLFGIILLGFCSYGITIIKKKKKSNKGSKLIKDGAIEISLNNEIVTLTKDSIKDFIIKTEVVTQNEYVGNLIVRDEKNEYLVLGINGNDEKRVKDDLDYIKRFIELKVSL